MKSYQVHVEVAQMLSYVINAKSQQEAEQQALEMAQATHKTEFIQVYACEEILQQAIA